MRKFIRAMRKPSTLLPLVFIVCIGFLAATQFLSSAVLSIITAAIAITVSVLIIISYIPVFVFVARAQHRVEEQNLFMGIILLFCAIGAWNFWRVAFTILGRPEWMVGHWFPSLLSLIASLTGFYFLSAPDITRLGWRYTTIAILGSLILMAIGLALFDSI